MIIKKNLIIILCILGLLISVIVDYTTLKPQNVELKKIIPSKSTTIFAAYSESGFISDYVVSYLKSLKEITPNIIYITDNPISKKEIRKISPYVNHIIAQKHGEYDWGSFKRGYQLLKSKNYFTSPKNTSPVLILANDSTLPLTQNFKPILKDMDKKQADFYGITSSLDGTYHIQSYFLILNPNLYTTKEFETYLNSVQKQPDGLHVAYRYEVPFTQYFASLGFKHATFIAHEDLTYLPLNDKTCYPLTLMTKHNLPFLKMRTFTNRLTVQEPRRLVFSWLKQHRHKAYKQLIRHLKRIDSPYLKENHEWKKNPT